MRRHLHITGRLFLLGALVGTVLDAFLVYNGVKVYSSPDILGVSWWSPFLIGLGFIIIGYADPFLLPLLGYIRPAFPLTVSLRGISWLFLVYVLIEVGLEAHLQTGQLLIVLVLYYLLAEKHWQQLLLAIVVAITGTLIEMILVSSHVFSYHTPDVFGVPFWLPLLYICASLSIGDIGRTLLYRHAFEPETASTLPQSLEHARRTP